MTRYHSEILIILCLFVLFSCTTSTKMWQADRMVGSGNYSEAIAMYTQIMKSNPDSEIARKAHFKAGKVYYKNLGETDTALRIFERIVKRYPKNAEASESLWILGMHYYNANEYQQARKKFIQLILDFPKSKKIKSARLQIAACYEQSGEYQKAVSTYIEFENFYPEDSKISEIVLQKGNLYEKLGQNDKAMQEYQRVVSEFPFFTREVEKAQQRLTTLGAIPITEDKTSTMENELRQVGPKTRPNARVEFERWKPSPTFGYNPRELLMGRDGNALFGGIELEASLDSDGALLDDALYNMGLMYYMMEDYKRAGACLEKAVEIGIKEADAYLRLGICYREVSALKNAKQMFKKTAELDLDVLANVILDSENRAAKGDYEKAIHSLKLILGISAELDKRIHAVLNAIYQKQGSQN